jgi:acyl carrier protein
VSVVEDLRMLLADTLQLGARAGSLTADSALLNALPELDSQAVVQLITAIEDHFGFTVADDEVSADTFATLGTLSEFVAGKCA